MSDFDNPWKDVLEHFFGQFLEFFFPDAHAAIDWSRRYESLDKELQQIVSESELGLRLADKLFKVWLKDGQEAWILIHVEIQNQRDPAFAERMFVYNYRIYDRHRQPVISLAVMGDEEPAWRPDHFGYGRFGCMMGIRFPIVKLVDYASQAGELETAANPFAAAVLAHLKTRETRADPAARRAWKLRLIKSLYDRGLDGEQVRLLFKFLDVMLVLPRELERSAGSGPGGVRKGAEDALRQQHRADCPRRRQRGRQDRRQDRRQSRGQGRDIAEVAHQAIRNPRPRGTGSRDSIHPRPGQAGRLDRRQSGSRRPGRFPPHRRDLSRIMVSGGGREWVTARFSQGCVPSLLSCHQT